MPRHNEINAALPPFDLKAAREAKGMTQEECAKFFIASQASIARWEDEGTLPGLHRQYWELYWKHNKPARVAKEKANAKTK